MRVQVFISGEAACGKSTLARELVTFLSTRGIDARVVEADDPGVRHPKRGQRHSLIWVSEQDTDATEIVSSNSGGRS